MRNFKQLAAFDINLFLSSKTSLHQNSTQTNTQPFCGCLDFVWTIRASQYQKKHSLCQLTSSLVISHLLSASSICYDVWHPTCSIYVLDSLFPQSLSKLSLVYLLAWHPPLHTPYISSPNHYLLFAPLSSDRQHLSCDVCLEVRGEIIRTVLFCIVY